MFGYGRQGLKIGSTLFEKHIETLWGRTPILLVGTNILIEGSILSLTQGTFLLYSLCLSLSITFIHSHVRGLYFLYLPSPLLLLKNVGHTV